MTASIHPVPPSRNHGEVLIFGGCGFIGSNWAHWLLQNTAAKVHVFDDLSRRGAKLNQEALRRAAGGNRLQVTLGDVRDAAAVAKAVRHADEIYHFAAQVAVTSSLRDPRHDFEVNVGGTMNILEAARLSGRDPFLLFTSTNKVYGDLGRPTVEASASRYRFAESRGIAETQPLDFHSPYGCSKGAADQYVRDYARIYGLRSVVFRMSCIAGERQFGTEDQGWVAHFLYSALQRKPVTIFGDGRQVRDVLYVGDLMRAFDAARANPACIGEIFNVGGGEKFSTSLLELIELLEKITREPVVYRLEAPRPGDQLIYLTDYGRFTRATGWRPEVDVESTVRRMLQWWNQHRAHVEAGREAAPLPVSGESSAEPAQGLA